ncbi:MAG: hypothetical protein PHW04_08550 [Candidatus Wallbacteria bacterium]|nr:hypothetical protein [Candidatus Wallbacteria bacterium]
MHRKIRTQYTATSEISESKASEKPGSMLTTVANTFKYLVYNVLTW